METNNATFAMVQKYPYYRVLSYDHPCVTNTHPVYIDRYDKILKIGNNDTLQIPQGNINLVSVSNPVVAQKPSDVSTSIDQAANYTHIIPVIPVEGLKMETPRITAGRPNEKKNRFDGDELLVLDLSNYQDLLEDIIPAEEISVLAGPGGVGKSGFYLHFCILIALGETEFIGKKLCAKFSSALIIATEDNEKRLSARLKKMHAKISPEGRSIRNLVTITTGENIITTITAELERKNFDIVVIDALTDILESDQNSPVDVRQFYNKFEVLIRKFQTTFLFVTHMNKSASRNDRFRILGSTAIVDRARSVFTMDKDIKTGIRTIKIEKSNNINDDKIGKPIRLRFDPVSLTYAPATDDDIAKGIESEGSILKTRGKGKPFYRQSSSPISDKKCKPGRKPDYDKISKAKAFRAEGKKLEEIAKITGVTKGTVSRWLNKCPPKYDLSIVDSD